MLRPSLARTLAVLTLLPALLAAAAVRAQDEVPEPEPANRLGEVVIEGNTRTDEALIRRELGLVPGQPFTYDDMDAVWDHLEDLGYFAFVDMEYDDTDPQAVVLRVLVEEDITLHYGPLVRYDRRHKYLLGGRFEERNLRGHGETLAGELSLYYMQRAALDWTHPWLLGVRGLSARVALDAEQAQFVFRPTRYRKADAGLDVRWIFAGPFYVAVHGGWGWWEQRDTFDWRLPDRGDGPGDYATFEAGTLRHWVYGGAVGVDTRDNPYYPRQGVALEAAVRRWLGDGFADYTESTGDLRVFVPVPIKKHVLAAHAWSRRTDGPAQPDNVLFLGGPETVRGQRFGRREGDEGWLLSVEYRAPLFIMPISPRGELVGAGLHAFADAGDAWYHGAEAGRPLQSWGAGVHLNLDTLQLRFEAARTREGDWVFEFMDTFNF